jgi:hypothetical protein
MNCIELQASLAEFDCSSTIQRSPAQQSHLRTCAECSSLVAELSLIAAAAIDLRDAADPSPRVWNSLEIALRQEGLIRPQRSRSLLPSLGSRWSWARWVAPVAAVVLVAVSIYLRPHAPTQQDARQTMPAAAASNVRVASLTEAGPNEAGLNDEDLLQEVAQMSPALQTQYAENLRSVNEYIRDAKGVVAENPNDEEARRSLLEAYQEKAMLFDLAMDRSLQ